MVRFVERVRVDFALGKGLSHEDAAVLLGEYDRLTEAQRRTEEYIGEANELISRAVRRITRSALPKDKIQELESILDDADSMLESVLKLI